VRSILTRIGRAVGWFRFVVIVVGLGFLVGLDLRYPEAAARSRWTVPPAWIFWLSCGAVCLVVAVSRYRRSAAAPWYADAGPQLVASQQEFCLVLRPFGSDGDLLLPDVRLRRLLTMVLETKTAEQAVGDAVRAATGLPCYAVVDQSRLLSPPGLVFLRAKDGEWQEAVSALIRRAHSIVLILPPRTPLRAGFRWEIKQIAAADLQERVLLFLPPVRHRAKDPEYVGRARSLLTDLLTAGRDDLDEHQCRLVALDVRFHLSDPVFLVRRTERGELHEWVPGRRNAAVRLSPSGSGRPTVWTAIYRTCRDAIGQAVADVERDMEGQDFDGRYPFRTSSPDE
jgi:hypothetical protein